MKTMKKILETLLIKKGKLVGFLTALVLAGIGASVIGGIITALLVTGIFEILIGGILFGAVIFGLYKLFDVLTEDKRLEFEYNKKQQERLIYDPSKPIKFDDEKDTVFAKWIDDESK